MRYLLLLCLFFLIVAPAARAQHQTTTFVVLRHAEKDTAVNPADPPLSVAGRARAQRLAAALKKIHPDVFYSTATTRTRETVRPWAEALGKPIFTYDHRQQTALADSLKKVKGMTFVIVGHSNTIPYLIQHLNPALPVDLQDTEYDRIWVINFKKGGSNGWMVRY